MDDWQRLQKRVDGLVSEFDGSAFKTRLKAVGKELEPLIEDAVKSDIGDTSMSGWRHKAPMNLTGYSAPSTSVQSGIFMAPSVKHAVWNRGLGPMRVLQDGRQAYNAGDRRASGWRTKKKTGEVVQKFRKVKRKVGATKGKQTWTHAVDRMSKDIGKRVNRVVVKDATKRHFK